MTAVKDEGADANRASLSIFAPRVHCSMHFMLHVLTPLRQGKKKTVHRTASCQSVQARVSSLQNS
jgi:hypothetical protein